MLVTPNALDDARPSVPWVLRVHSTPTLPTVIGGLIAVTAIIVQMSRGRDLAETYAFAFIASTAGLGFALDDDAAEVVAASPTPLARRRLQRVAIVGTIVAATWLVIAGAVATSDRQRLPTYDIIIEVAALTTIGLATSALVQQRTQASGGLPAAIAVLVGPAFLSSVVFRDAAVFPSLLPGQALRDRWIYLALAGTLVLALTSRDPAHRRHMHFNSRQRHAPRKATRH